MNRMSIKIGLFITTLCVSLNSLAQNNNEVEVNVEIELEEVYDIKEPEAIDMGGSVLWASFNLHAEKPSDVGIYCGWGDPTGNLRFQADDPNEENYIEPEACLAMYGGLEPTYNISGSDIDIVHRHLKNGWQMPSKCNFDELHDCKWELTRIEGTLGYKVTANNGNSIFLPAWNNEMGEEYGVDVAYGCYWTSSICHLYMSSDVEGAYGAYFFNFVYTPWWLKTEDYDLETVPVNGEKFLIASDRWAQLMIRPVKPKSISK